VIKDKETNFVYFSKLLKFNFEREYIKLISILDKHQIKHGLLSGTKDIWCRDYMPIQVDRTKFVQFKYEPTYLNDSKENQDLKSNPKIICKKNNLKPFFSKINLDGGNIVKWSDQVILTDRIFNEIQEYNDNKILNELEKILEAQIIIIPQIKSEMTGHADGLVRFYNSNTILVNELENEYKYWQKGILKSFKENNFDFIEVPWFSDKRKEMKKKYPNSAIGLYINFLEIQNLIIIPKFKIEDNRDDEAFKLFKKYFPERTIEQIEINEIAKYGGLLNCISWNVYKN